MIKNKKSAFTMIELIVVIIIIGVLSTVAIEKLQTNNLKNAAKSLANDIRYLQYLALNNDVYDNTKEYKKKYWQFFLHCVSDNAKTCQEPSSKVGYTIFSDSAGTNTTAPSINEIAKDYIDSDKYLAAMHTGTSIKKSDFISRTNLKKSFSIDNVSIFYSYQDTTKSRTGVTQRFYFNEFGETYANTPGTFGVQNAPIIVRLEKDAKKIRADNSICIKIEQNTGLVSIPKWSINGQELTFGKTPTGKIRKVKCHKIKKV